MSQSSPVVIKKRRRHAFIDPCLGFYVPADSDQDKSHQSTYSSDANFIDHVEQHVGPAKATDFLEQNDAITPFDSRNNDISSPLASEHNAISPMVTVEDFLCSSARARKKYRRKAKKRRIDSDAIPPAADDSSRSVDDSSHEEIPAEPWRKPLRKPKAVLSADGSSASYRPGSRSSSQGSSTSSGCIQRPRRRVANLIGGPQTLRKRLIAAAVMSYVDPIDSLLNPQCTDVENGDPNSRRPLRFVPDSGVARKGAFRGRIEVVDPKKHTPFRDMHIVAAEKQQLTNDGRPKSKRVRKPLTQWQIMRHAENNVAAPTMGVPNYQHRRRVQIQKIASMAPDINYPPLTFIPIAEAEKVDKLRKWNQRSIYLAHPRTSLIECARKPLPFAQESILSRDQTSGCEDSPAFSDSPAALPQVLSDSVPRKLPLHSCSPPGFANASATPVIWAPRSSDSVENNSLIPTEDPMVPRLPIIRCSTVVASDSRISPKDTQAKELRPLPSFLDGFLNIIRATVQGTAENTSTTKHRRTRPSTAQRRQSHSWLAPSLNY